MNNQTAVKLLMLLSLLECFRSNLHTVNHQILDRESNFPSHNLHYNGFHELNQMERLMTTTSWHPINITFYISKTGASDNMVSMVTSMVNKRVLPRLASIFNVTGSMFINSTYYNKTITTSSVAKGVTTNKKRTTNRCSQVYAESWLNFNQTNYVADLLILITMNGSFAASSSVPSTAATGSICGTDPLTYRPVLGLLKINLSAMSLISPETIDMYVDIMTHECFHIFGFSGSQAYQFPLSQYRTSYNISVTQNGLNISNVFVINTTAVVAWTKAHFNCSFATGLPFEDQLPGGSMNSHWEKRVMGNEIMGAQANGRMMISGATLAYFQDSGWYQVDMTKAENLSWGLNRGCDFLSSNCSSVFPEFSASNKNNACSSDYISKTQSVITPFSDTCFLQEFFIGRTCTGNVTHVKTNEFEVYGSGSRCFMVSSPSYTSLNPGCYLSNCTNGVVNIQYNGNTYNCTNAGTLIVIDSKHSLTCPDPVIFCAAWSTRCPNDCNGNGKCQIDQTCLCGSFYSGSDCSIPIACATTDPICGVKDLAGGSLTAFAILGSVGRIFSMLLAVALTFLTS